MNHNRKDRVTEVGGWTVRTWWDPDQQTWATQLVDRQGAQFGDARFASHLSGAMVGDHEPWVAQLRRALEPKDTIRLRMTPHTGDEFWCLLIDLGRDQSEDLNRRLTANALEDGYHRTQTYVTVRVPVDRPIMNEVITSLFDWGDPLGGWYPDLMFRCRPFCRMGSQLLDEAEARLEGYDVAKEFPFDHMTISANRR